VFFYFLVWEFIFAVAFSKEFSFEKKLLGFFIFLDKNSQFCFATKKKHHNTFKSIKKMFQFLFVYLLVNSIGVQATCSAGVLNGKTMYCPDSSGCNQISVVNNICYCNAAQTVKCSTSQCYACDGIVSACTNGFTEAGKTDGYSIIGTFQNNKIARVNFAFQMDNSDQMDLYAMSEAQYVHFSNNIAFTYFDSFLQRSCLNEQLYYPNLVLNSSDFSTNWGIYWKCKNSFFDCDYTMFFNVTYENAPVPTTKIATTKISTSYSSVASSIATTVITPTANTTNTNDSESINDNKLLSAIMCLVTMSIFFIFSS
jgi:hypothetical protein